MLLKPKEAAILLGYTTRHVYRLMQRGQLPRERVRVTPFHEISCIPEEAVRARLPEGGEAA